MAASHKHPDHLAGVMDAEALAFFRARGDRPGGFGAWHSGDGIPETGAAHRDLFLRLIARIEDRPTFVTGGDSIAAGIVAEAASGRSVGHMLYRVTSAGSDALIRGDVTNHHAFSHHAFPLAHPDSAVGFDDDRPQAIATRNRVLALVAGAGTLIIGHHMPFPGVGHAARRQLCPGACQLSAVGLTGPAGDIL